MSMSDRLVGTQDRHRVRGLLLSRPLAIFDVETTGVSPSVDRIIEITIIRVALDGSETLSFSGLAAGLSPGMDVACRITGADGASREITLKSRIDTDNEVDYFVHGGILHYVLRRLAED